MERKAVSLRDVAAVAGVSLSTASKVLRGQGKASEATRKRILEAAERLDFQPNALGQFLAQGRSATIGILAENAPGAFTMPVLTGATTAFGERDLSVLVYDSHLDRTVLSSTVRKLKARKVDGLLMIGDGTGTDMHSVSEGFSVPVVYAYGVSDDPHDASFMHDGFLAGRLAAEHLIGLGRTRLAHITASPSDLSALARAEGLRAGLADAGLSLVSGQPLHGDWSRSWGIEAARRLLAGGESFDAVFCGNDTIASAVQEVLRDAGTRVPEDVAIVGMDNLSGLSGQHDGLLTTIDPHLTELGAVAARYLADAIEGGEYEGGVHTIPCTLIPGESTGVRPRSAGAPAAA
ncbi:LacI family DNA-binding transcriptional regulator [Herbiconiux sp. A18JL235]|uniref:LacI family DNA-binding transcriptional regulator n=1 Tax=Herbiconiux sp. A18JL235 TaxID=3152363 RepID=A0AB39BIE4_9MICO